jgi:arsenate reductase
MAEALLRRHAGDQFEACSAGLRPKDEVHPLTLRVLEESGIDTTGLHPKGVEFFMRKVSIHHAVIVCENVQEHCPRICPFALQTHYWPFDDPAGFEGPEDERLERFRKVRDQIEEKLFEWLAIARAH